MEPVPKWDAQHDVLLRGRLPQHAPVRPQFTGAEQFSVTSHDLSDHARRESERDSYSPEDLNCWTIRPPCPNGILDGVEGSFAKSQQPGISGDSWRCASNLVGFSCPPRDARHDTSGGESDASLDAEVASLTSGRRLGLAYSDARLLPAQAKGKAAAAVSGLAVPTTVSPPSRYGNKEPSTLLCLLSPSLSQQQPRAGNWAVTPSPTEGERGRESERNASAGPIEVAGEAAGVAGQVLGGLWTSEPAAKRHKCGSDWDSSRCRTPFI